MSLIQYEIFARVAELNSFTQAAEQLGLTQSAVSHAVNNLEKTFGFRLINRNRAGIRLTAEGEQLLPSIHHLLQDDEKIHQEASAILGVTRGSLRIGVFTSISKHLLPQIIQTMEQNYPLIRISLKEGNYQQIEDQLIAGRLDCGFVTNPLSNQLLLTPIKRDRILCIVSPQSPLYHQKTVSFSQIGEEPFIMPAFGGHHEIRRILEAHHVRPRIRFELMEEDAILAMVAHHLGISILPELVLPQDIAPLRAIPLETNSFRTIQLATRLHPSPAAKAFVSVTSRLVGRS
ncbi:LysR family transcriptional regulator [Sporolactobacillus vineae]|uniref:LysR family transcriptional regulator n=1 Tax=Sporolactobacillus vineae TaxID=444463 RepID=UPI00028896A3|nr:LysR family transcriptional regulator [Sporolactobacillus vineae]